ncbi:glycoside hydrolase family 23 protein [Athelia psychrophila]|uniref:Glycoside hydrolase family 23 protein n=1 Tax=Athelia psychrophila TaxID=1759441 RepID=A0A166XFL2_9AGAM|nr:glycoside hydrolase family 23 protein [Fibularhizoctonia sp. CBS 109695]
MKFSAVLAMIASSIALVQASTPHAAPARRSRLAGIPDRTNTEFVGHKQNTTSHEARKTGHTLINVKSTCGAIGATKLITAVSGPNGNLEWLNCGMNAAGWTPPHMTVNDIVHMDLATALQDPNSPFKTCSAYLGAFEQFGNQFGVPPILLASFALQESSCNPNTIGGAGEQGIMQITKEKCAGATNCLDPWFNIMTGAKYFANTLNANNGDLLKSIGSYNGWFTGMTYNDATKAAHTGCCHCQNNLDYLHQFLNGWMMNVDAYMHNPKLGKYFNLNVCK